VLGGPCNKYSGHAVIVEHEVVAVIICQILLLPRHEEAGVKVVVNVGKYTPSSIVPGRTSSEPPIMNFAEGQMDSYSSSI
jgi:hypothetical protein